MIQPNQNNEYQSPFPNPWLYHQVPREDMRDLMQLYSHNYLGRPDTLPKALEALTHHPDSVIGKQHPVSQSHNATSAAMFFLISDFIAMKYARLHPTFEMKPMPQEVLNYLRFPFCKMTSLDIEDQRRFKASLPPEQQGEIYIDE